MAIVSKSPEQLAGEFPITYTLHEVALAARVSVETIKMHRRKGFLQAIQLVPNGRWMVPRQAALDYLAGKGRPA